MNSLPFIDWILNQPDAEHCSNCSDGEETCTYCDGLGCNECGDYGYFDCETCQGTTWVIRKPDGLPRAALVVYHEQRRKESATLKAYADGAEPNADGRRAELRAGGETR